MDLKDFSKRGRNATTKWRFLRHTHWPDLAASLMRIRAASF